MVKNHRAFAFALEPLLAHRKHIEEQCRHLVATRARECDKATIAFEALEAEHRRHRELLVGERRSHDSEALRVHYAHLEALERRLDATRLELGQRRATFEAARVELLAAAKERKALEKLKERRFKQYGTEQSRAEAQELDDANARFRR